MSGLPDEEAVRTEVEKGGKAVKAESVAAVRVEPEKTRQERLEEYLLALILQADDQIQKMVSKVKPEELAERVVKKIIEECIVLYEAKESLFNNFF